jgi:hypothetical protein
MLINVSFYKQVFVLKTKSNNVSYFRILVAILHILGSAGCIDFYITSPYDAISWNLGQKAMVTWNILPGGSEVSSVNVDLMDGDDNSANVICNIASGLPPSSTSASWEVPKTLKPGKSYFVRLSDPSLMAQRYSHRFSINGQPCSTSEITKSSVTRTQSSSKSSQTTSSTSSEHSVTTTESIDFTTISLLPRSPDSNGSPALLQHVYCPSYLFVVVLMILPILLL